MAEIVVSETAVLQAAPDVVYAIFTDYHDAHPRVLPRPHFGALVVEQGGTGAGTRFRVDVRQGLGMKTYRMDVTEPQPGRVLLESDVDSDLTTTFTVEPAEGVASRVTITTRWTRGGFQGFVERMLAARVAGPIYRQELRNVERLARERSAAPASA
jgi:hypothetical protein